MVPPLLNLDGICLTFGGTPLLDGAALTANAGDKVALVGRNGSGKSTLLKIVAGMIEPQDGKVFRQPSATIRYLPQMPDMEGFASVRSYVEAGLGPADDPHRATYLLNHLGLTGEESPDDLSGGEARRGALARVMAPEPDIMLLDEPTNHLDLAAIEWLEEELIRTSSTLIVISHDRRFLERVSRNTVWLDRGQTRRLNCSFAHFEEWRDQILKEEERDQHKLGRQIIREEHWLRYGVTARRKRNMRRLSELQTMRQCFRDHRGAMGVATMVAREAVESGKLIIEAKNIDKSFGDLVVVKDFSTRIHRGDRIGLVGPNGAGKTALLKMLTGELEPDAGTIRLGVNLDIATLDQKREAVDPHETLSSYLTHGLSENFVINCQQRHIVSYMKDFLFKPEQARTPVRELSGGERARLILARALARPANLLALDEPTNDLDMETLELLEELVAGFAGTVILVTHDRDFLDRTVTSIIAPDVEGRWIEYPGGYTDMLAQRGSTKLEDRKSSKAGKGQASANRSDSEAPKAASKRLSFKQKFALEDLPKKMEAVSVSISRLENQVADPAFYERDPCGFQKTIAALNKERETLTALEEEWFKLEMLREELEG